MKNLLMYMTTLLHKTTINESYEIQTSN